MYLYNVFVWTVGVDNGDNGDANIVALFGFGPDLLPAPLCCCCVLLGVGTCGILLLLVSPCLQPKPPFFRRLFYKMFIGLL